MTYFDILLCANRVYVVIEWAGLVTLTLGGLLMVSIVRAAPPGPEAEPGAAKPELDEAG